MEELEADSVSLLPAVAEGSRGGARVQVFLARYRWALTPAPRPSGIWGVWGEGDGGGVVGVIAGEVIFASLGWGGCSGRSLWLTVDNKVSPRPSDGGEETGCWSPSPSSSGPPRSYNPFEGPNENPEAELPLTAGEYIYIYGSMDEDGFFEGRR